MTIDLSSFYAHIGYALRDERQRRNLTQQEVADLVSLTRTSITNIEAGRQKVTTLDFVYLCRAVGVAPARILSAWKAEGRAGEKFKAELDALPNSQKEWVVRTLGLVS